MCLLQLGLPGQCLGADAQMHCALLNAELLRRNILVGCAMVTGHRSQGFLLAFSLRSDIITNEVKRLGFCWRESDLRLTDLGFRC
jgi:hypothetical protein